MILFFKKRSSLTILNQTNISGIYNHYLKTRPFENWTVRKLDRSASRQEMNLLKPDGPDFGC
jgi:hypothetical protein